MMLLFLKNCTHFVMTLGLFFSFEKKNTHSSAEKIMSIEKVILYKTLKSQLFTSLKAGLRYYINLAS
jgi:hypothetical protein